MGLAAYGYQQYVTQGPLAATKIVEVRNGLRTPDIAADLEQAGVITNGTIFTAAAYLTGSRGASGRRIRVPRRMPMRDVLGLIVQGKSRSSTSLRFGRLDDRTGARNWCATIRFSPGI